MMEKTIFIIQNKKRTARHKIEIKCEKYVSIDVISEIIGNFTFLRTAQFRRFSTI